MFHVAHVVYIIRIRIRPSHVSTKTSSIHDALSIHCVTNLLICLPIARARSGGGGGGRCGDAFGIQIECGLCMGWSAVRMPMWEENY